MRINLTKYIHGFNAITCGYVVLIQAWMFMAVFLMIVNVSEISGWRYGRYTPMSEQMGMLFFMFFVLYLVTNTTCTVFYRMSKFSFDAWMEEISGEKLQGIAKVEW